jgi:hypothetical protein
VKNGVPFGQVCGVFQKNLSKTSPVDAMLSLSGEFCTKVNTKQKKNNFTLNLILSNLGLCNLLVEPSTAPLVDLDSVLSTITTDLLPTTNTKLENR